MVYTKLENYVKEVNLISRGTISYEGKSVEVCKPELILKEDVDVEWFVGNKDKEKGQLFPMKEGQTFYLWKLESGVIAYGVSDKDNPTKHGGLWSSSESTLKEVTGISAMEAKIANECRSCKIQYKDLLLLLKGEYVIIQPDKYSTYIVKDLGFKTAITLDTYYPKEKQIEVTALNIINPKLKKQEGVLDSFLTWLTDNTNDIAPLEFNRKITTILIKAYENKETVAARKPTPIMNGIRANNQSYSVTQMLEYINKGCIFTYKGKILDIGNFKRLLTSEISQVEIATVPNNQEVIYIVPAFIGLTCKNGDKIYPPLQVKGYGYSYVERSLADD